NIVGTIRATPSDGDQIEVVATKHGRRRDFDLVEIEVVEHSRGVTVCVLYPEGRRGRRRERNHDGEHGRGACRRGSDSGDDDIDVEVDFEIRVPAGVTFIARTVVGNVEVAQLAADVEAYSVSGDITVETSGLAEASTVSGDIEVHLGRTDWRGDLVFNTVSGNIRVHFPEGLNADVTFQSVTGDIESDFPISLRSGRGFMAGNLRGTIGEGGPDLTLRTVSGDAALLLRRPGR
ncbi:MAG: DUF4097 domain-containing protein, partial [Gemmatimonadales bacterium]